MYQIRNKELEILALFRSNYKSRFYLRQISRNSGIALKTCQDALHVLEKEGIIKSQTEGKNKYFSLNLESTKAKHALLQAEINKTEEFLAKYPVFQTFLKELNSNSLLVIFGSFADFSSKKDSDIDLITISDKKINLPKHLLPNKVQEINLKEEFFIKSLNSQEPLIKEIQSKHIILNNHSLYVNIMWSYYAR